MNVVLLKLYRCKTSSVFSFQCRYNDVLLRLIFDAFIFGHVSFNIYLISGRSNLVELFNLKFDW